MRARGYDNPWDGKAALDPSAWAPQNLQIEDISITEKKLTWTYNGDDRFEGFKIDRKKGDEPWQTAHKTFPKEARSWNNTEIVPEHALYLFIPSLRFCWTICSSQDDTSFNAAIPAPLNLQIEKLTDKSYKLTWTDNINGEQGYKINRKIDYGNWQTSYGIVSANQVTFIDTNVFYKSNTAINVEYQVCAFYENYESDKATVNTNAELTAPSNLVITPNSITSVALNWQDNSDSEDGFKIEKKI